MADSPLPVAVIVLTQDEARGIDRCLDSVKGWAAEVWVVDSGSTDDTLDRVRKVTDRVAAHPFETYAAQRNWAQENLELGQPWVFHLDADEAVSPKLQAELAAFFQRKDLEGIQGALVRRRILFLGRELRWGGLYPTYHCRLYRKGAGRCEDRRYDQHFVVEGRLARLEADVVEHTAPTLAGWTARHARWAQLEAEEMAAPPAEVPGRVQPELLGNPIQRRRWAKSRLFGRAPRLLRAFAYFLYRYVLRLGFLDGRAGLVYHGLQGFWFRFYIDALAIEKLSLHRERSEENYR